MLFSFFTQRKMALLLFIFFTRIMQSVCTDTLSLKTNNTQRVKFILYIYIIFMCLDFVLSTVIIEMAVFLLKIQRHAQ